MVSAKQTKVYQEKGKTVNNALDCPCLAGGLTSLTTSCILCLQSHGKKSFSIVTASSTLPLAQKPYDMPHDFLLRTKMLYLKPLHEFSILEKCKLFPKSFIRLGFFFFLLPLHIILTILSHFLQGYSYLCCLSIILFILASNTTVLPNRLCFMEASKVWQLLLKLFWSSRPILSS